MHSSFPRIDVVPEGAYRQRRQRLRERVTQDWLLVSTRQNVRYLTGFTGTNGAAVIGPAPADDYLVVDDRYGLRARSEAPEMALRIGRDPFRLAVESVQVECDCGEAAAVLAVESDHISWHEAGTWLEQAATRGVTVVGVPGTLAELRLIKDDAELQRLQEACRLTVAALEWLFTEVLAVDVTERDLAIALEHRMLRMGAEAVAFPTIVASGPNSAIPHHRPGQRQLRQGDVLTVDCGAVVDGYHADCTRTVSLGSVPSQLAEVYEVVVAAQAAGRAAAVAGTTGGRVDRASRSIIEVAGFGENFTHGTGHGVGLDIHEPPAIGVRSGDILAPGMTLTVEPGIYLAGLGGVRIEDTLVIRSDGSADVLTDAPREFRQF